MTSNEYFDKNIETPLIVRDENKCSLEEAGFLSHIFFGWVNNTVDV